MHFNRHLSPKSALLACVLAISVHTTLLGQETTNRLPPTQVMIDTSILAAFVDEPCHHFEEARATLIAMDPRLAATHLRTSAAFLKLEAARATPQGRVPLVASARELANLAEAVEQGSVREASSLDGAFARAHYALAAHHCLKAAHRCCWSNRPRSQAESKRASHDLQAAAKHLERASWWAHQELDTDTKELLKSSRLAADALDASGDQSYDKASRAIMALGNKLEQLTGRKIMIAPPVTEADDLGPSIFR